MPLPWIKMWIEGLDDPKLTRMSLAERGAWWDLLKLAAKCEAGGRIVSGGIGLELDEIADSLHIKTADERQALESMIVKMAERGSLMWNEGHTLVVVNYEKRQMVPPSSRPEAIAKRQRTFRERKKKNQGVNGVRSGQTLPSWICDKCGDRADNVLLSIPHRQCKCGGKMILVEAQEEAGEG